MRRYKEMAFKSMEMEHRKEAEKQALQHRAEIEELQAQLAKQHRSEWDLSPSYQF